MRPYLLYSDGKGNIFEDTSLYALGRTGYDIIDIPQDEWIELPHGGDLMELHSRKALGQDVATGELRICDKGWAVACFVPPAHTGFYLAAYDTLPEAETLPLYCYNAVGWHNKKFYVPATRIEKDIRQDCAGYNTETIKQGVEQLTKTYKSNRLVQHLADMCTVKYNCPAARNFFSNRWECPIPVSPACNANCVGCISFQEVDASIISSHNRLTFKPSVAEIVEYTVPHLETAPYPIVSFGQGCEGEPLLMVDTIEESILEIRKHTPKGSININTNGSNAKSVERLMKAGLNSIRVSMNSAQEDVYTKYYRPNNYAFNDLKECIKVVKKYGGWASINYFVFPGMTDSINEYNALVNFIKETNLDLIQWRNFNIDPDWYLNILNITDTGKCMGIKTMMDKLHIEFPNLKYGYFNPPAERIKNYEHDFAH